MPRVLRSGAGSGGPGYANHLTASVTGGITVNSAQIVIPPSPGTQRVLQVALSLNTTAATPGTRTVSIVNPDGQGKSAAIISVIVNRVPVSRTGGPYAACQGGGVALDGTTSTDPDAACGDLLVTYEWDLNNDGTFDITGATPTVTGAQLATLGVGVGANTIKLRTTDTHAATNIGSGTLTILADGAGCDDGIGCTSGEACASGVCAGTPNPPGEAAERALHRGGHAGLGHARGSDALRRASRIVGCPPGRPGRRRRDVLQRPGDRGPRGRDAPCAGHRLLVRHPSRERLRRRKLWDAARPHAANLDDLSVAVTGAVR